MTDTKEIRTMKQELDKVFLDLKKLSLDLIQMLKKE